MEINFKSISAVYFLGIGGIGMSALARYFHAHGKLVAGYDRTSTVLTDELIQEGIAIHFSDDIKLVPEYISGIINKADVLIVRTPAVPDDHQELNYFLQHGYSIMKRSEILGLITKGEFTYAVAGTHGKTTTSTLLAWLLHEAGKNCTAFLGGISIDFNSNLLLGKADKPDHCVVTEADEYDRSFLKLFPDVAIITSMDPDHLDIYGDKQTMEKAYAQFAANLKPDGILIIKKGLPDPRVDVTTVTYSIDESSADYFGSAIEIEDGFYRFDLITPGFIIENLHAGLPGRHNVENAVAALAAAIETGIDLFSIQTALQNFRGVRRRFEIKIRRNDLIYIDDYAHHPEEIRAAIQSAKEFFPERKLTVIFQPHLFSRTRDFAEGFAEVLSAADQLYLLDIYPAREKPIEGITSAVLLEKITAPEKKLVSKEELMIQLEQHRPDLLMTLGAGDIDQMVQPIIHLFTKLS